MSSSGNISLTLVKYSLLEIDILVPLSLQIKVNFKNYDEGNVVFH